MPLYDYKCKSCGHEFEELVAHGSYSKGSGHTTILCSKCKSTDVERKFPAIANTPAKWGEIGARNSLAS